MINEAITAILKTYCPRVYSPAVTGDKMPASPFLVFTNELGETIRIKEGIVGYQWILEVEVLASTAAACEQMSVSLVATMESFEGNLVIDEGEINLEEITFVDESGRQYIREDKLHTNTLQFIIESNKR